MERIKQFGWLGAAIAVAVFIVGLGSGALLRNGAAPPAYSQPLAPPPAMADLTRRVEKLEHRVDAKAAEPQAFMVTLVSDLGAMKVQLGTLAATLDRIAERLDRLPTPARVKARRL